MGVRVVFLPECPLVLSLLKHRGVWAFLNQKMRNPNRGSSLNSSIDTEGNFSKGSQTRFTRCQTITALFGLVYFAKIKIFLINDK